MQEDDGSSSNIDGRKSIIEHCFFPWTIEAFLPESELNSDCLGTLLFSASDNDECFSLWQIDLKLHGSQNDIQLDLTRLRSHNTSLVFVRFHWAIVDAEGNKVFPGSIHSFAYPGDKISKKFVEIDTLLEDRPRFLADGNLQVLCDMSAYGRTVEEKISSALKSNVPFRLSILTEDMEAVLSAESSTDLCINVVDGMMNCHKSILSARSNVFAEILRETQPEDYYLDLEGLKADSLHAILTHIYFGNIDMYLQHTIPKDLYSEAERFGLPDLKEHLDYVKSDGSTMVKKINVTWKLPFFNALVLQPKVLLQCPEPSSNTFYDNRWRFKLEFDSSSENAAISVVRKQEDNTVHLIKFIVQIETYGRTSFEKIGYFLFDNDGSQGLDKFMSKDELGGLVSFEDTLVLMCSLEVLRYYRVPKYTSLSSVIELFSKQTEVSLSRLAEDLGRLHECERFSDAVVTTKIGVISYHSYLAEARFLTPEKDLKAFLENLNPKLVQSFFLFLYGGNILASRACHIRMCAREKGFQSISDKFSDFLAFCTI